MQPKILLIDDDADFKQLTAYDLKKNGYEVLLAADGEEGLLMAQKQKPDLILLDIKMPKMDGYTLVRRLKKEDDTKAIPLIVLTSYEPMKDMFQLEGVKEYIVKSAESELLLQAIKKNLVCHS